MNQQAANNYLRTKVMTATPEQLQLMLYDGAIQFAERAKIALQKKKYDESYNNISRAQKIITELTCGLRREISPELCDKLQALYNYVYRMLVQANVEHKIGSLDEALKHLRYQRQTWTMLMEQLGKRKAAAAATKLDMPAPDSRMEASISLQG